jgi:putative CocE/NonD family hydrolase
MNPAQTYKFTLDLSSTSNVFRKGHRLRLEIGSSNFPRFDRDLNTGEESASARKSVRATNSVYHDAEQPSVLILPIVPVQ